MVRKTFANYYGDGMMINLKQFLNKKGVDIEQKSNLKEIFPKDSKNIQDLLVRKISQSNEQTEFKIERIKVPFSKEPVICSKCGKFLNPPTMVVVNPICSKCWLRLHN